MKNPFRKQVEELPVPQEPRIAGCGKPYHSLAAKQVFIDVMMCVSDARRPPAPGEGFVDGAIRLDRAIEVASEYCNDELAARMKVLREAAIDESENRGSPEATRAALQHFTLGCRVALGTND